MGQNSAILTGFKVYGIRNVLTSGPSADSLLDSPKNPLARYSVSMKGFRKVVYSKSVSSILGLCASTALIFAVPNDAAAQFKKLDKNGRTPLSNLRGSTGSSGTGLAKSDARSGARGSIGTLIRYTSTKTLGRNAQQGLAGFERSAGFHGAIAVNFEADAFEMFQDVNSVRAAKEAALKRCQRVTRGTCEVVAISLPAGFQPFGAGASSSNSAQTNFDREFKQSDQGMAHGAFAVNEWNGWGWYQGNRRYSEDQVRQNALENCRSNSQRYLQRNTGLIQNNDVNQSSVMSCRVIWSGRL